MDDKSEREEKTKISDEIRELVHRSNEDGYMDTKELLAIADRIDAETVELPKSADGKIWTGREMCLWTGAGNKEYRNFHDLVLKSNRWYAEDDCGNRYAAESVWYERPDSFERIAEELDKWCDCADADTTFDVPFELADRIRNLAKEQDHE